MDKDQKEVIQKIILNSLQELSIDVDFDLESIIFGQSSALESVEFVTILADIEENLKHLFGLELDCFELLLSNQGKDISVQDLSVLIFDSLHGK